jgi:hypothetical protein
MITRLRSRLDGERRRRPARRITLRWPHLTGKEREMATALAQLKSGVPLSWSQIEDDDALATLEFLQPAASEAITRARPDLPAGLRRTVYADFDARLPAPRPVAVKEQPKSLAGFSERVQVLTQVEEEIPPIVTRVPQWIAACALAAGGVALLFFALSSFVPKVQGPSFRWVELRLGGERISQVGDRSYWTEPSCLGFDLEDPEARREFISIPDSRQMQAVAGFPVLYPPTEIPVPGEPLTYRLRPTGSGISTCTEDVPDPTDPGQAVRFEYLAYSYTTEGRRDNTTRFKIFQGRRLPQLLDVTSGTWEQVEEGNLRGVYWRGDTYRDIEGRPWREGAHVLVAEREDVVLTIIAEDDEGMGKGLLANLAAAMGTGPPADVRLPVGIIGPGDPAQTQQR